MSIRPRFHPFTALQILFPRSFVLFTVRPDINAFAAAQALPIPTVVGGSSGPSERAVFRVLHILFEEANVHFPISPRFLSFSVCLVLREVSIQRLRALRPGENTFSVLLVVLELASVTGAYGPGFVAYPVRTVVGELTHVLSPVGPAPLALPGGFVVHELANIDSSALFRLELSALLALQCADILGAGRPNILTGIVGFVVVNLAEGKRLYPVTIRHVIGKVAFIPDA